MSYINGKEILFSPIINTHEYSDELLEIKRAIIAKGGNIEEDAGFEDVAPSILDIPVGDTSYVSVIDSDVSYKKQILSGAMPLAQLHSIGGMSYKTDNLLPLKYSGFASSDSVTDRGCTFTNNGDGGIALSGTPTGAGTVSLGYLTDINTDKITASVSGTFTNAALSLSIYDDNGLIGSAIRVTAETVIDLATDYPNAVRISASIIRRSDSGGELSGVIYPMVNKGDVALPHSLPFEGLRDSAVTELKAHGANLTTAQEVYKGASGYDKMVVDGRNCIRMTSGKELKNKPFAFKENTQYTVSFYTKTVNFNNAGTGNAVFTFFYSDGTYKNLRASLEETSWVLKTLTSDAGKTVVDIGCCVIEYRVYNYIDIDTFMLNEGTEALPYTPFKEAETIFQIPAEIQAIDGFGKEGFNIDLVTQTSEYNGEIKPLPVYIDPIIEIEGGGSVEFVNEYKHAVPNEISYIRRIE